jgi:hypothetical protein
MRKMNKKGIVWFIPMIIIAVLLTGAFGYGKGWFSSPEELSQGQAKKYYDALERVPDDCGEYHYLSSQNDKDVYFAGCGSYSVIFTCTKPVGADENGEALQILRTEAATFEEIADFFCDGELEESFFQKFLASIKGWAIGIIIVAFLVFFGKMFFPMFSMAKYYILLALLVLLVWFLVNQINKIWFVV